MLKHLHIDLFGVLWIFACSDSYGSPKQLPFFEIKPLKWHLCAENERRVRSAPACGLLETPAIMIILSSRFIIVIIIVTIISIGSIIIITIIIMKKN